jgi:CheY-like chemotaxis protein
MLGKVLQSLSITYEEAEDGVQAIQKVQVSLLDLPFVRRFDLILVSVTLQ